MYKRPWFKREIYRVGAGLRDVKFAVFDDPGKFGNFEVFRRILERPEGKDANWKSAKSEWTYSIMASCDEDFPPEKQLGDAVGSGALLAPKPIGEDKTGLQTPAGDVTMGTTSSESASSASKVATGGANAPTTYSPADAGGKIAGPYGPSPVLPATQSSVINKASSSTELKNLIIFPSRTSASMILRHRRPESMSIFQIEPAVCIDPAANQLLGQYVTKLNEISKWRQKWDGCTIDILNKRSAKGQVRNGAGTCAQWRYGVDDSPPYVPEVTSDRGFQVINMQASVLLDFAEDVLNLPTSYWRNDSDTGNAARANDNFNDTAGFGRIRRTVVLRIVRAKYGLPKCSFTTPLELYREDDVYYFPDGAAFGRADKVSVYMAAYILSVNPAARMEPATRSSAEAYLLRGALTDAARVPAIAPPEADSFAPVAFQRIAAGSSSSGAPAPAVKKKPAANKTETGPATKKK